MILLKVLLPCLILLFWLWYLIIKTLQLLTFWKEQHSSVTTMCSKFKANTTKKNSNSEGGPTSCELSVCMNTDKVPANHPIPFLFCLPTDLSDYIFSKWLKLSDIGLLDCAVTQPNIRDEWLLQLQNKSMENVGNYQTLSTRLCLFDWMYYRKYPRVNIIATPEYYKASGQLSLRINYERIKYISSRRVCAVVNVINRCPLLSTLYLPPHVPDLNKIEFHILAQLTDLEVFEDKIDIFFNHCKSLKYFTNKSTKLNPESIAKLAQTNPSLTSVRMSGDIKPLAVLSKLRGLQKVTLWFSTCPAAHLKNYVIFLQSIECYVYGVDRAHLMLSNVKHVQYLSVEPSENFATVEFKNILKLLCPNSIDVDHGDECVLSNLLVLSTNVVQKMKLNNYTGTFETLMTLCEKCQLLQELTISTVFDCDSVVTALRSHKFVQLTKLSLVLSGKVSVFTVLVILHCVSTLTCLTLKCDSVIEGVECVDVVLTCLHNERLVKNRLVEVVVKDEKNNIILSSKS